MTARSNASNGDSYGIHTHNQNILFKQWASESARLNKERGSFVWVRHSFLFSHTVNSWSIVVKVNVRLTKGGLQ